MKMQIMKMAEVPKNQKKNKKKKQVVIQNLQKIRIKLGIKDTEKRKK